MEEFKPITPEIFEDYFDKYKNKYGFIENGFVELSTTNVTFFNLRKNSVGNYTLEYYMDIERKRANIFFENENVFMSPNHLNVFSELVDITFF